MLQITISKRAAVILALAVLLIIPATAGATHIFTDVVDSNVHAPGIEWVADNGVTSGCGDGSTYCPNDAVTRAQMGTFMHRLSGNAAGVAPSVAAATALQADNATTAGDADTLDGLDSADLQPIWALVDSDGTVIQQSGGISVTVGFTGGYYMDFGEDLRGRPIAATLQWNAGPGMISTAICGSDGTPETVFCVVGGNTTSELFVETTDDTGTNQAQAFYVMVMP